MLFNTYLLLSMSSDESYDPEDDRKKKIDKSEKKKRRKWLKKRKGGGPASRAGELALKQQRRRRGKIDRSVEIQRKSKRRRCGDIDRSDEIQRLTLRRKAGDVDRSDEIQRKTYRRRKREIDRTGEAKRLTCKRRARVSSRESELNKQQDTTAIDREPSDFSIWTSCTLPSDEQLKLFHKDPDTVVAAFRLMAGIPADPRICNANLQFDVDEEHIISRFAQFCGHGAAIKICGACGIGDFMSNDESYRLPLTHTRIISLLCDKVLLDCISDLRRQSMHLLESDGQIYHLDPAAFDDIDKTINICATCYTSLAHALRTGKPPIQTFAFYDYGVVPADLPQLTLAETIATSINIVIQVILNLRPLGGISQTAAKGHAIAVPLTGVQSLATKVYELPRTDLCEHIQLVVVAKKGMWKAMRRLLQRKGPLTCDPRKILTTLLYRKGVENENYENIKIPTPQEMDRISSSLNGQMQTLLKNAFFSDSMIADRLIQNQRTEVEDEKEGLYNFGCDEVIVKGVLLTEAPNAANPMSAVLQSLKRKLDITKESCDNQNIPTNIIRKNPLFSDDTTEESNVNSFESSAEVLEERFCTTHDKIPDRFNSHEAIASGTSLITSKATRVNSLDGNSKELRFRATNNNIASQVSSHDEVIANVESSHEVDINVASKDGNFTKDFAGNIYETIDGEKPTTLFAKPLKKKMTHKVYVEHTLLNEFENNPELIGGAFADLLPLGFTKNDLGKGGTLPTKLVRTWLLSHDRRFAKHRSFNHFIFNQKIRHETNMRVSMRVKGNDEKTRKLTKLINEPDFEERLRKAVDDPMGDDAQKISKSVLPFLKIVGSQVKWSSFERSNALTHLYAMNHFFGLSFLFVTVSPSLRNSPLALRLCYCSQDTELELPDLVLRTKLIANNSVAAARTFHRVVRGFFEIICGIPLSHFTGRKTNIDRLLSRSRDGYIGAFGKLKGIYAVTEEQTGGSLHMHGQLFGIIDQRVLSRWIHVKSFRKDVCKFIDSIVTTEIPEGVLKKSNHRPKTVVGSQPYPTVDGLSLDSAFCRLRLNSHSHSFTCWKGECITCRMAYPRPFAEKTYITEIVPDLAVADEIIPVRRFQIGRNGDEKISDPPCPSDRSPVDPFDERVIASGLRRTSELERKQCESNPIATVLLRCNTSIQPTIAPTQARNAVFYSSKYCSKNPYKLSSTLSLLYTAQLALRNYGSVADDAGSATRNTKCLLQKLLHKTGQIEVADQQAAAANLGYDSFFSSHKFCYVFIWDAVKRVKRFYVGEDTHSDTSDSEDFDSLLDVDENGKFFSITQFDKYIWKSSEFSQYSLYDYSCCVCHTKSRENKNGNERYTIVGRKTLKRYPFEGIGCKLPESLMQTISTSLRIPILAGAPPPKYPGEKPVDGSNEDLKLWEQGAKIFVYFYSLLFLPFDNNMDPRDPTLPHLAVLP